VTDVAADKTKRRTRIVVGVLLAVVIAGAITAYVLQQGGGAEARPPERRRDEAVAVRTAEATVQDLPITASYPGELDAEVAEVAARTSGLLLSVEVRIGDPVEEGALLATIDTAQAQRQLAEVQAERAGAEASARRAQAELGAAQAELERSEPLVLQQLVSAQEIDALRARRDALDAERAAADAQSAAARARLGLLRQQIADARLVAPFAGAVAERHLDPGAVVQPGTPVVRIVRSGPPRVRFRASERDLGRLASGMRFRLTTQATEDRVFEGTVERIAAAVAREDRTVAVEGLLDAEDPALRTGMHVELTLELGVIEGAVTVPGEAIVEREDEAGEPARGLFVAEGDRAVWRAVETVGRSGDRAAVRGVDAGAAVIVVGQDTLRDGSRIRLPESS
jgi:RND family efflux transporter MFP subunit